MKPRLAVSALLVSACVIAPTVPDVPARLTAGPGCSIEVLPLPPSGPYQTLSRASLNTVSGNLELLAAEGCRLGADAIVVPVPPEFLRFSWLVGTFVKRLPRATSNGPTPGS